MVFYHYQINGAGSNSGKKLTVVYFNLASAEYMYM